MKLYSALKYSILLTCTSIVIGQSILTITPVPRATGSGRTEVQALFEDLVNNGLLRAQSDAKIAMPQPDDAMAAEWNGKPQNPITKSLTRDLYVSPAGSALLAQLESWNRGRNITAVRDNGIIRGLTNIKWQAYNCSDQSLIDSKALVDETFGYIHQGRLRSGFGEWRSVNSTGCVNWEGHFTASKPVDFEVLYVGRATQNTSLSGIGKITSYRPPRLPNVPDCMSKDFPESQAGSLKITSGAWHPSGNKQFSMDVTLRLEPARNPGLSPQGLQVAVNRSCQPEWQEKTKTIQPTQVVHETEAVVSRWLIETQDGVPLLTNESLPTPEAEHLGLLPIVGHDADDPHGIAKRLQLVPPGGLITLTINSKMQEQARASLQKIVKTLPQASWATERRASVVLLNANGDILAAVSYPDPPSTKEKILPWDIAAFSRVYPVNNPFLERAWEGLDRHQASGSTMKPVTAIAGLKAAATMPNVRALLDGLNPTAFQNLTGLSLRSFEIDPYRDATGWRPPSHTIKNFENEPIARMRNERVGSHCSKNSTADCYDLSLTAAVRGSINVWFVALAMQMDGRLADGYQNTPLANRTVPDLHLLSNLRSFGFGKSAPLFLGAPNNKVRKLGPWQQPDQIDIMGPVPSPMRWILSQNAIGQGTMVTPLRMASIAASIATGSKIQPHLDAAWDKQPAVLPAAEPLNVDMT
ncbi:hypothetical protein TI04_06140, partial [Achromatium sp. WMS2]